MARGTQSNRAMKFGVAAIAAALLAVVPVRAQSDDAWLPVGGGAHASVTDRESRPLGGPGSGRGAARTGDATNGGLLGPAGSGRTGTGSSGALDNPLLRTGGSLGLVLALIYGLSRLARRYGAKGSTLAAAFGAGASPAGVLEVLGRFPIGRGQTLVLLRIDNRVLLLAQTSAGLRLRGGGGAGGLTTLCELSNPEDVASLLLKVQDAEQASTAAKFGDLLGRFDAKHAESGGGVVEVAAGRKSRSNASGDRAELWDANAVVGGGGSLRDRLKSLRTGGARRAGP